MGQPEKELTKWQGKQSLHWRKDQSVIDDVQHLSANLGLHKLEEFWTGYVEWTLAVWLVHLPWSLSCWQQLGFPIGSHLPVIPSGSLQNGPVTHIWLISIFLLPVGSNWSRSRGGDLVQARKTQLRDFRKNIKKKKYLPELVTVGCGRAVHGVEGTCWDWNPPEESRAETKT